MILIIIFSFQYYFLAKVFNKNILKTILSAIGLYFGSIFILTFLFSFLFYLNIINLDIEPTGNVEDLSLKLNQYFQENRMIMIIMEVILFILIGVIYYNYLKRKWTLEMLNNKNLDEFREVFSKDGDGVEYPVKSNYPKMDLYVHFHHVNEKNIHLIQPLAKEIWNEYYKNLLSRDQIDYMLELMYNIENIQKNILNNEIWEIIKIDNIPSGYLHYKLDENETVFLSKIYLTEQNRIKGIGQMMLNHVIEYANEKGSKLIRLTVNKKNTKAIRFYEKNGFKKIEEKVFYIGGGYKMDDYIYEKNLTSVRSEIN